MLFSLMNTMCFSTKLYFKDKKTCFFIFSVLNLQQNWLMSMNVTSAL